MGGVKILGENVFLTRAAMSHTNGNWQPYSDYPQVGVSFPKRYRAGGQKMTFRTGLYSQWN